MTPILQRIAQRAAAFDDLPEVWQNAIDFQRFTSAHPRPINLYDYQQKALQCATTALHLYYAAADGDTRAPKERMLDLYKKYGGGDFNPDAFDWREGNRETGAIFDILARGIAPTDGKIAWRDLINRMGFWMATGSGKTLVMIKLIELLARLMKHNQIPRRKILVIAPRDDLLNQIRQSLNLFNRSGGVFLEWTPLRDYGKEKPALTLGETARVYFARGDLFSEESKKSMIDYREFESDGEWYVLLDEAHKGAKEDSKRQAYYSLLAREGFLFNFSATFISPDDVAAAVFEYNLSTFIGNGYGKRIWLGASNFEAFRAKSDKREISIDARRDIILKSLLTLAFARRQAAAIRAQDGLENAYHEPLMTTLVNSVNTEEDNDLRAFFNVLKGIAENDIDKGVFERIKGELAAEWRDTQTKFPAEKTDFGENSFAKMTLASVREEIFYSPRKGQLRVLDPQNKREMAFQLSSADRPFALMVIGETSRWERQFLAELPAPEKTPAPQQFFRDGIPAGKFSILMGSRAFFEGWDSNRPNVINFINIGVGDKAKKFVIQALGRGVRIEPLPGCRKRADFLPDGEIDKLQAVRPLVKAPETLFLYATKRAAIDQVLAAVETEKSASFVPVGDSFRKTEFKMPLLKPVYRKGRGESQKKRFVVGKKTHARFAGYMRAVSDSVLLVGRGFAARDISNLRAAKAKGKEFFSFSDEKEYPHLGFMQERFCAHLRERGEEMDKIALLGDGDIVHFQHIEAAAAIADDLRKKARETEESAREIAEFAKSLSSGQKQMFQNIKAKAESPRKLGGYSIRRIAQHYYNPVVSAGGDSENLIRHVINTPSEARFVRKLEEWLKNETPAWEDWAFSKLDESLDKGVYIPYFDGGKNSHRRFRPDFVFWLRRGRDYRIVFVDPKSTAYAAASHKIDGYADLFESKESVPQKRRAFDLVVAGKSLRIDVKLVMFNDPQGAPQAYRRFWSDCPSVVFAD